MQRGAFVSKRDIMPVMRNETTDFEGERGSGRQTNGLRIALGALAAALVVGCGYLWMRFGAQVFLDAALFAWRSCF